MYPDTIFSSGFVSVFLTALLHLHIQDTKIHIPYLEIICIYVCRIKESAEFCIQFCILPVFRRFCTIRLSMARIRVSALFPCFVQIPRETDTLLYVSVPLTPTRMGIDSASKVGVGWNDKPVTTHNPQPCWCLLLYNPAHDRSAKTPKRSPNEIRSCIL
jgi:hypothetical protein